MSGKDFHRGLGFLPVGSRLLPPRWCFPESGVKRWPSFGLEGSGQGELASAWDRLVHLQKALPWHPSSWFDVSFPVEGAGAFEVSQVLLSGPSH